MLRVFGVIVVVLISLAWIAYSGFEILAERQNRFNPEFIFSDSLDESVLKINFTEELNNFKLINSENSFLSLAPNKVEGLQLYFSHKRSILILEKEDFWTPLEVNSLVNKTKLNASDIINQKGKFLCFSKEKNLHLNTSPAFNRALTDKNATANIFNLAQNKTSDIYIKSNRILKYQTKNSEKIYGDPIEDKALFSDVLPAKITSYLFNSHFYALQNDTVYANSTMAQWVDKGFVEATFQGETFLVSDYKTQQNLNLVLLQHLKDTPTLAQNGVNYFQNLQLTDRFPKDNGFYLCLIEDKVILTNTEKLAHQIKLTHQLGSTLAVNKGAQQSIFADLTSAVHTRTFNPNVKFCETFTKDIVYSVTANGESKLRTEEKSTTFSFLANAKIDFICPIKDHIRKGTSVFVIANKQYYLVSSKGNKIWQGNLDFTQKTQPQVVDVYQNNKLQITFTNGNKIYVIDLNGNLVNGFPLIHNASFSTASKPVTWKNQTTFLAGDENGKLMYYNSKGGELNAFSISNQSLKTMPTIFNKEGVLTCLVHTNTGGVKEVLIDKNKVNALAHQADAIVLHRKEPYLINYKNTGTTLTKASNNESFGLDRNLKLHTNLFSAYSNNQLEIFALNGEKVMDVQIQVSEITEAKIVNTEQSNLILILDDLENKIYLFDNNGTLIDGFPKEGKRLIDIKNITKDSFNVYSTIGQNLICYSITL